MSSVPSSSSAQPKTQQVQQQVDEVVGIMQDNITKVMARGEQLDSLQNKTDQDVVEEPEDDNPYYQEYEVPDDDRGDIDIDNTLPPTQWDLSAMTPQQMEQYYIANIVNGTEYATAPTPDNGLSAVNHPTKMAVSVVSMRLHKVRKEVGVRVAFRNKKLKVPPAAYPEGHKDDEREFAVTYHSLLFDYLKVDIMEPGILGSNIGRARIRLARLPQVVGTFER
ncbi:hypothetical protein BDK51DRAFT_35319, partial [Blyttiomyces helicus]